MCNFYLLINMYGLLFRFSSLSVCVALCLELLNKTFKNEFSTSTVEDTDYTDDFFFTYLNLILCQQITALPFEWLSS